MMRCLSLVALVLALPLALSSRRGDAVAERANQSHGMREIRQTRALHSPRVAVCFFGSPRSLIYTRESLVANAFRPLSSHAKLDAFVHALVAEPPAANLSALLESLPRWACPSCNASDISRRLQTADQAVIDREWSLWAVSRQTASLAQDRARRRNASALLDRKSRYAGWRRRYPDDTIVNVYRSRLSARLSWTLAFAHEGRTGHRFSHVLLARLDTALLSSIEWPPAHGAVSVPDFHQHDGVNDRLAFGERWPMSLYLRQFDMTLKSPTTGRAKAYSNVERFQSEMMLCDHLTKTKVRVALIRVCVLRVRANGALHSVDLNATMNRPTVCEGRGLRVLRLPPGWREGGEGTQRPKSTSHTRTVEGQYRHLRSVCNFSSLSAGVLRS